MMIKSGLGLAVAAVACPLFAIGAGWFALQLIRINRAALVSALPLKAEQTVAVETRGDFVVSVEVPRLSTEYRQWELEVTASSTRQTHRLRWGGPRATGKVSGFSTVKIPLGRITLAHPDTLTIRINGLTTDKIEAESHVILTRPYLARMAIQIAGIVLCAVAALVSLLGGLWSAGMLRR